MPNLLTTAEFKYKPNINFEGYTECFQYRKEVLDIFLEG